MARKKQRFPKYINGKNGKRYHHRGGDRYENDDGDFLTTAIVLAILSGDDSPHGYTPSSSFSDISPGEGNFGGAGATGSWDSDNSSSHSSSDSSSSSDSGGGDSGGGGGGD